MNLIFAQSLAIVAVFLFLISFHAKSRARIIFLQAISLVIWALHFYLLSAWTGAALMLLNVVIATLLLFKEKLKRVYELSSLAVLFLILIFLTVKTWQGFYSIFAFLAVTFINVARWQNTAKKIRLFSILPSISWLVYDAFAGAYGSVIAEVLILISIWISLVNNKESKRKKHK